MHIVRCLKSLIMLNNKADKTLYKTKYGKKLHRINCKCLKDKKIEMINLRESSLEFCKICFKFKKIGSQNTFFCPI